MHATDPNASPPSDGQQPTQQEIARGFAEAISRVGDVLQTYEQMKEAVRWTSILRWHLARPDITSSAPCNLHTLGEATGTEAVYRTAFCQLLPIYY